MSWFFQPLQAAAAGGGIEGTGAASVSNITGSVAGVHGVVATGSGSIIITGSASGVRGIVAVGAGSISITGSAAGFSIIPITGTAAGSVPVSGAASGVRVETGTGTASLVGISGTASGNFLLFTGTAAGSVAIVGTATGAQLHTGTGAGSVAIQGSAAGVRVEQGTAVGSVPTLTGVGAGVHGISGVVVGNIDNIYGAASESAPADVGTAEAQIEVVGAAVGVHGTTAVGVGTVSIVGASAGFLDVEGAADAALAIEGAAQALVQWPNVPSAFPPGVGAGGDGKVRTILWDRGRRVAARRGVVGKGSAVVSVLGSGTINVRSALRAARGEAQLRIVASAQGEHGLPVPLSEVLRRLRDFFATGVWDGVSIALPNDAGTNLVLHTMALLGDTAARRDLVARLGPEIEQLYTLEARLDLLRRQRTG